MQAKVDDCNDNIKRLQALLDELRLNADKLYDDYNGFREKIFEQLKDRVYTLEKKVTNLFQRGSDMSHEVPDVQSDGELGDRVTALEAGLN